VKRFACLLFISFTICKLFVQAQELTWYEGSLVLRSEEVFVGSIAIEPEYDLVLLRSHDTVSVYPAHKIYSVQFYNARLNMNKRYISVQEHDIAWKRYKLYEVVVYGDVHVLRKEKEHAFSQGSDVDDYIYFTLQHEKLNKLKEFHSKVYPELETNGGVLLSMFILENDLRPKKPAEAIRIIQYYNKLIRDDQTLAAGY